MAITYTYERKFGSQGSGNGQFLNPHDISFDASGNLFVCDRDRNDVQKFTNAGVFISKFGGPGSGNGQFNVPYAVQHDPTHAFIYVADRDNNRIQKLDSTGTWISNITTVNGQALNAPEDITFDKTNGDMYITDTGNNRIVKLDSSHAFIREWGSKGNGNGQFDHPHSINVDSSRRVYVSCGNQPYIQKFSSTGVFQRKFGSEGTGDGQTQMFLEHMDIDRFDRVHLINNDSRPIINVWDANGTYLTKYGNTTSGSANGQFKEPEHVTCDPSNGKPFVVDCKNFRIQVFSTSDTGTTPPPGTTSNIPPIDLGLFLTGGSSNTDPNLSLGGNVSSTEITSDNLDNLFRRVTESEAGAGVTLYRCVAIKNKNLTQSFINTVFYMVFDTTSVDDLALYSKAQSGKNVVETAIVNEFTTPLGANINFIATLSRSTGIVLGNLAPGEYINVWLRVSINPGAKQFTENKFKMRLEINGSGSGGTGTQVTRTIYYSVIGGSTAYQDITITIGSELVEAQTSSDPTGRYGNFGWKDMSGPILEIGDPCEATVDSYPNSLWSQAYWSNSDNNCVIPNIDETDLGTSTRFTYQGGKIMKNPRVWLIYWGTNWRDRTSIPTRAQITGYVKDGYLDINAEYFDKISQYGGCGVPIWGGDCVNITMAIPSSALITEGQAKDVIVDSFNRGLLPIPSDSIDNFYIILLPVGKGLSDGAGGAAFGLHDVFKPLLGTPGTGGGGGPVPPPDPETGVSFKMSASGDTGTGGTAKTIHGKMKARGSNMIIYNGDLSYSSSMSGWLSMTSDMRSKSMVSFGNHDVDDGDGSQSTINALLNAYSISKTYYSKIFHNVGIVVMEAGENESVSSSSGSAQYNFVKSALQGFKANASIEWIFVCNHYPIEGPRSAHHPNEDDVRDDYVPLFDTNGVDAIFTSHNHDLWHSKLLKYNAGSPNNPTVIQDGPDFSYSRASANHGHVYFGVGGGGQSHYDLGSIPSYVPFQNQTKYGYLAMNFSNNGKTITFKFYDSSDNLLDTCTITHS